MSTLVANPAERLAYESSSCTETHLSLTGTHRVQISGIVTAGHPHETCGLLIGRRCGDEIRVLRVTEAQNLNVERARDRFQLDPQAFISADREARSQGLDIVGIWHSHPDCPARPSLTDLESAWEGYSYLIVSVSARGAEEFRSWRLQGDLFWEERVEEGMEGAVEDGEQTPSAGPLEEEQA